LTVFHGVVVLNGASSAGKSTLVRALQERLREPWLATGIDVFLTSLPARLRDSPSTFTIEPGGHVVIGPEFRALERAWMLGVAATARAGANVVVDDVFLSGGESQARWKAALKEIPTRYIAVHCERAELLRREANRKDRIEGLAANQLAVVRAGVTYDHEVDTSTESTDNCARALATDLER
jgi:chloramphenicol 3-O phosphotransferase